MICTFFGHSDINTDYKPYLEQIRFVINDLIVNKGVTTFYSGGHGHFDNICRDIIYELKSLYPYIRSYLVLSYIPKPDSTVNTMNYDGSLYLLKKRVPLRYAISKTNELMIDMSDYIISGVIYNWGGAFTACEYARRKKKKTILIIEK